MAVMDTIERRRESTLTLGVWHSHCVISDTLYVQIVQCGISGANSSASIPKTVCSIA